MGNLYFYKKFDMGQKFDAKGYLSKIGKQVRKLRKEKTQLGYIDFAKKVKLNKKTYYKIERGEGDYNISNLIKIISYYSPDISLTKFFYDAGL